MKKAEKPKERLCVSDRLFETFLNAVEIGEYRVCCLFSALLAPLPRQVPRPMYSQSQGRLQKNARYFSYPGALVSDCWQLLAAIVLEIFENVLSSLKTVLSCLWKSYSGCTCLEEVRGSSFLIGLLNIFNSIIGNILQKFSDIFNNVILIYLDTYFVIFQELTIIKLLN